VTKKQNVKQKDKTRQLTLLAVMEDEFIPDTIDIYATEFFVVRTTAAALDAYNSKLMAVKSNGAPKLSEEERTAKRLEWIQRKMRVMEGAKGTDITGDQFYASKHSLLKKIFGV
jgi:hypothetical protein